MTEVGVFDFGDGDVHIDTIEERAGEFLLVGVDLVLCAGAFVGGVAEVATRAGIHSGDEHKVGRVGGLGVDAGDGDFLVFERLAKCFENGAGEFGDFVEEEDAEVSERDFAWLCFGTAADDGSGGGGMMRRAERTGRDDLVGFAGEGVNFGDGDLLFGRGRWEEIGGGAGEEGFAGARRTGNEDVVVPGDSDGEGTFSERLTADVVENWCIFVCFCIFYNILGRVFDGLFVLEVEEEFLEVFDTDESDVREEGSLCEVFQGDVDFRDVGGAGGLDDVNDAVNGTEGTVKREFADEKLVLKVRFEELSAEGEDGEGDGEIKIGTVL